MTRAIVLACAFVAACDYPPLDGGTTDGGVHGDGAGGCDAPASFGSATLSAQFAKGFPGNRSSDNELDFNGTLDANHKLAFAAWDGNNTFPDFTNFAAASTSLSGSNLQSSPAAVFLAAKCNSACDVSAAPSYYFANGGTLQLTQVSPNATGSFSSITLAHATIDFNTGTVTFLNDGCQTTVSAASFSIGVSS